MQGQKSIHLENIITEFASFYVFQWQINGFMSMAKSSNIAAVWILMNERGGAIAGPLGVQEPASTIERHMVGRRWEPGKWAHRQGMGRACICDWSPRPQGAWSIQHTAAVEVDSTRLRGRAEEKWGSWQSAPEAKWSLGPTGQFMQMEGGLCLRALCWLQLTVQGCVPLEFLKTDILCSPLPTLGPL